LKPASSMPPVSVTWQAVNAEAADTEPTSSAAASPVLVRNVM